MPSISMSDPWDCFFSADGQRGQAYRRSRYARGAQLAAGPDAQQKAQWIGDNTFCYRRHSMLFEHRMR
jgi:hypothetical protein